MKLKIAGKTFDFFNQVSVNLKFDSVGSTFSFNAVFDHTNEEHRFLFQPFSYRSAQVLSNNGDLLITGTILNNNFTVEAKPTLANISGYSKTGVLEDCPIPVSLYPLQFDGVSLAEITRKLIRPFGIGLIIDGTAQADANSTFEVQTASESQSIKSFLAGIASQKNIILSHTSAGSLVLTKGRTSSKPVAKFGTTDGTATRIKLNNNGQKMHSSITVQKQPDMLDFTGNASESRINNPLVSVFRPTTKSQNSGGDNDTFKAAQNALGSELRGIGVTIETDRLEWLLAGKFETIKPNNVISVLAPECFIFKETNFFIESVTLKGDEKQEVAVIQAVLPEVYNGNIPSNIFR